jgi:predicted amidohydrolase YtcJ
MTLNSYEKALNKIPKEDHRFRIEHCTFVEDRLADRIQKLGVIPVIGPAFMYWVGDGYLQKYHPEWLDWAVASRRLLDRGIPVAFHSDLPVVPCNPLPAIYSAVTRKTLMGRDIGPNQKVTVQEAVRAYTYAGAYASFEEKIKGSIEVGKLADLVVLSENILRVAPEKIKDMHVDLTMVDGVVRYRK